MILREAQEDNSLHFAWHPTPHVGGTRMLDGRTDSALILEDLVNVFRTRR